MRPGDHRFGTGPPCGRESLRDDVNPIGWIVASAVLHEADKRGEPQPQRLAAGHAGRVGHRRLTYPVRDLNDRITVVIIPNYPLPPEVSPCAHHHADRWQHLRSAAA